jgi:transposase-like protein
VPSEGELEPRVCPVCRRKMKLARVGGLLKVTTYQCLSCKGVMTVENGSYFEWLMSRPKSKRAFSKGRG